jgi:hypothetical protein
VSLTRDATAQTDTRSDDTGGESTTEDVAESDGSFVEPDATDIADIGDFLDTWTAEGDVISGDDTTIADADVSEPDVAESDTLDSDAAESDVGDPTDVATVDDTASDDVTEVPEVTTHDAAADDISATDISVADADGACTGPTCVGADWPAWTLTDLNPTSPTYNQPYSQPGFLGKATMLAILRSG